MALGSLPPRPLFKDVTQKPVTAARSVTQLAVTLQSVTVPTVTTPHVTGPSVTAGAGVMVAVPGNHCPCCGRMVKVSRAMAPAERQRRSRANRKRIGIK